MDNSCCKLVCFYYLICFDLILIILGFDPAYTIAIWVVLFYLIFLFKYSSSPPLITWFSICVLILSVTTNVPFHKFLEPWQVRHMCIYRYILVCMGIYHYIRICMGIYGYVWVFMGIWVHTHLNVSVVYFTIRYFFVPLCLYVSMIIYQYVSISLCEYVKLFYILI